MDLKSTSDNTYTYGTEHQQYANREPKGTGNRPAGVSGKTVEKEETNLQGGGIWRTDRISGGIQPAEGIHRIGHALARIGKDRGRQSDGDGFDIGAKRCYHRRCRCAKRIAFPGNHGIDAVCAGAVLHAGKTGKE